MRVFGADPPFATVDAMILDHVSVSVMREVWKYKLVMGVRVRRYAGIVAQHACVPEYRSRQRETQFSGLFSLYHPSLFCL